MNAKIEQAKAGNGAARDWVLRRMEPIVKSMAREYAKGYPWASAPDLEQEARIAVLRAIERFNPDKGAAFPTYAYRVIQDAFRAEIFQNGPMLSVSAYATRHGSKIQAARRAIEEGGLEPTAEMIARVSGLSVSKVDQLERVALARYPKPLSSEDGEVRNRVEFQDGDGVVLADPDALARMERSIEHASLRRATARHLAGLTPREREVVGRLYGLGVEQENHKAAARAFGLTKQMVYRMEADALRALRGWRYWNSAT